MDVRDFRASGNLPGQSRSIRITNVTGGVDRGVHDSAQQDPSWRVIFSMVAAKARLGEHVKWTRIEVGTDTKTQLVDITAIVSDETAKTGVKNGTCFVYMPHTTAGLTINENADPEVARDILTGLARLVPVNGDYRHAEGNSDAHIKASLVGSSLMVPIIDGRLALGTWQALYFCEFDGPRHRHLLIGTAGE
ncbi:MAG: secondary thiamine-phosphate synthase enzyme YjbQ [Methanomicrobiales archaeon]|nr:secondary thiamine-phosphate synthase enzyme YjbQ [Methanomicrobiales archaeon]